MSLPLLESRPGELHQRLRDRLRGLGPREALRRVLPFLTPAVRDYASYVRSFGRPEAPTQRSAGHHRLENGRQTGPLPEIPVEDAQDSRATRLIEATLAWVAQPGAARREDLRDAAKSALDGAKLLGPRSRASESPDFWPNSDWPNEHEIAWQILAGLATLSEAVDDSDKAAEALWLARGKGCGLSPGTCLPVGFLPDLGLWLGAVEPDSPRPLETHRGELRSDLEAALQCAGFREATDTLCRFLDPVLHQWEAEVSRYLSDADAVHALRGLVGAARDRLRRPRAQARRQPLREAATALDALISKLERRETRLKRAFNHGARGDSDQLLAIARALLRLEDACGAVGESTLSELVRIVDEARSGARPFPDQRLDASEAPDLARWFGRTLSAHKRSLVP